MNDLIDRALREADSFAGHDDESSRLIRDLVARIRELEAVAKCDGCGKPFDENGGICEPCHSVAIAAHIKPLNERIRELKAERDILKALHDVSLASCRVWKRCAEKAEAERDQFEGELRISQAAVGHNMGVAKRIEVATIERCLSACMCEDCDRSIRALKPSGDPCEGQSEKPVNPYLLGGSSTQSEG